MPNRAMHACNAPRCPHVTQYRYCEQHEHRAILERALVDKERPQSQHRGYGSRWKRYSSRRLRDFPLCADPFNRHEGRPTAATQTDHIIPHKMDPALFWDADNHQSLCPSCGGYKSAKEQGGRAHSTRPPLAPVSGAAGFVWSAD
jgi:5-methylcytosine-specific restriction protein A